MNLYINDIPSDLKLEGDLAIDTEAMGLNIKRDRLCLIQIADSNGKVVLIHFPEGNFNYQCTNLKKYLLDSSIQKIFHYARFDVGIMRNYLNLDNIPNIFCTKIASRFCRTYTDAHGLRTLVMELLGVELKKEQQCSYWGAKELSQDQKQYAENDVLYLHRLRKILTERLISVNRLEIVEKYFNFLETIVSGDLMGFEQDMFNHGFVRQ